MKAKKKFLLITSIVLLVVMACSLFAGCKSSAEKEKAYWEKTDKAVTKNVGTLNTLTDKLFERSWSASFMYAYTYYSTQKGGEISVTRGDSKNKGWQDDSSQFVHFMYFQVNYKNENNYTIKTTIFEDTDRKTYYANKDKPKKFGKKFKKVGDDLTFEVKDGVESGQLPENGLNPLDIIKAYTDKEYITENGISASDNFRIYTHFMRIESRRVFDETGEVITRAKNDESKKAYWTGYGEDIAYKWNKVYGMTNNRLTVLYSKGKKKINQLEIYNERVISYYTKNNKVDTSLVLKADVIAYEEMVIKFEY